MSRYYKDFLKPRQTNPNALSLGFFKKNYSLIPLIGILASSVAAAVFMTVHKISNSDIKISKKEAKQKNFSSTEGEPHKKSIDDIKKIFKTNSELRAVYLDMEKAESQDKASIRKTEVFEGA